VEAESPRSGFQLVRSHDEFYSAVVEKNNPRLVSVYRGESDFIVKVQLKCDRVAAFTEMIGSGLLADGRCVLSNEDVCEEIHKFEGFEGVKRGPRYFRGSEFVPDRGYSLQLLGQTPKSTAQCKNSCEFGIFRGIFFVAKEPIPGKCVQGLQADMGSWSKALTKEEVLAKVRLHLAELRGSTLHSCQVPRCENFEIPGEQEKNGDFKLKRWTLGALFVLLSFFNMIETWKKRVQNAESWDTLRSQLLREEGEVLPKWTIQLLDACSQKQSKSALLLRNKLFFLLTYCNFDLSKFNEVCRSFSRSSVHIQSSTPPSGLYFLEPLDYGISSSDGRRMVKLLRLTSQRNVEEEEKKMLLRAAESIESITLQTN
jgi:hypothetical protein